MSNAPHPWAAILAICGALFILSIFALIDAYAIHGCISIARTGVSLPEICAPEHLFRTALEIGGMAIGLYGAARLIK